MLRKLLKFCSWNIEGVTKKLSDNNFLRDIKEYDFVTLVETWLPHDLKLEIDGFYSFSKTRNKHSKAKRHSGRISLLVKTELRQGIKISGGKLRKTFSILMMIYMFAQCIFLRKVHATKSK